MKAQLPASLAETDRCSAMRTGWTGMRGAALARWDHARRAHDAWMRWSPPWLRRHARRPVMVVMSNGGFGGVHQKPPTRSERKSHPWRRVRKRRRRQGCRSRRSVAARAGRVVEAASFTVALMYSEHATLRTPWLVRATLGGGVGLCGDDAEQEDDVGLGHHLDVVGRRRPRSRSCAPSRWR